MSYKLLVTLIVIAIIQLVLLPLNTLSQQNIIGASGAGSNSEDTAYSIVQDDNDYSYVTGSFSSEAEFGDVSLLSRGSSDCYLAKYDLSGECIWAAQIGGASNEYGKSLSLDNEGNIYIAGNFYSDTLFFNDNTYIYNSGDQDFFIAKFNTLGELLWARGFGYLKYDNISSILIDNYGNILLTGMFTYFMDFGNNISVSTNGGMDIFVAKLNHDGLCLWAKSAGGYTSLDFANDIACDTNGASYIIGRYNGSATFPDNVGEIYSNGSSDIFISKFGNTGQCQWATSFGGTSTDFGMSIDISETEMIYTTGYFLGTIDLDDSISLTSIGSTDVYVSKHNPDGSAVWAKRAGSTVSDGVYDLSLDSEHNVQICGYFSGSMVFDASNYINSNGETDAFFASYDSLGVCRYASSVGGSGSDEAVSINSEERTALAGVFNDSMTVDAYELESRGATDIFVLLTGEDLPELAAPVMVEPEPDEIVVSTPATFSWQETENAADFHLQVSIDHRFNDLMINSENIAGTFFESDELTDNCVYFWRVRANNDVEQSLWSNPHRFVTGQGVPSEFFLIAPVNESNLTADPVLSWEKSEGAFSYMIQLFDTEDMSNLIRRFDYVADEQLPIYDIEYGATYYWRVRAENSENSSDWSDIWEFTLLKQYPSSPELLFPENNYISEEEITLIWDDVMNSDGYHLQVSSSPEFKALLFNDSNITDTEKDLLLNKGTYYWRVRATQGDSFGYWNQPRVFSVNAPSIAFASGAGSIYEDTALDICSDTLGNVYTVGYISGEARFSDDILLNHYGSKDIFISRHDSRGDCLWAKSVGSNGRDIATSVIADDQGSIFIAGGFSGSVEFSESITLISNGDEDMFIAKYDSSGSCIWARSLGSLAPDRITDIESYNYEDIYISGYYSDTLVFDSEIDTLFSNGMTNIFIARIDTSGTFEWGKGFGSDEFDEANGIAVDADSRVYLTGFFANTVDFGGFEVESIGEEDAFVAAFDDSGDCLWAESAGSVSGSVNALSISADTNGNTYLSGSFIGSVYFSPNDSLVSNGLRDAFVCSYDMNGNYRWAFSGGGPGIIDIANDIEVTEDGDIYVIGNYAFTSIFDNKVILKTFGSTDVFVLKITSDGEILKQKAIGGNYEDTGFGIGTDKYSNVYACGGFKRTAYFNGISLESIGEEDIYISMVFGLPATKLMLPENNSENIPLSPWLSWLGVSESESYNIQIFEDDDYGVLASNLLSITDTTYKVQYLDPVTDYYWRVQAVAGEMASPWSQMFSFSTKFEVPVLASPSDGSYKNDLTVDLLWSNIRIADFYHLIVATDESFEEIIAEISNLDNNTYQLTNLDHNTTYFWKVRAGNSEYTGEWSDIWQFTTALAAPLLLSPVSNSTRLFTSLSFSWGQVTGATKYEIIVSDHEDFSNIAIRRTDITTNSITLQGLSPEKRYWWKVKAQTANSDSHWSEIWTFTTHFDTPPSWNFTENTGSYSQIIIPVSATIKIRTRNALPGDAIGVFYQDGNDTLCSGYGVWNNESLSITVWGDDLETPEKDGFADNEDFIFKLWDAQNGEEIEAEATIRSGDPDYYVDGEISYVFAIRSLGMHVQSIQLTEGWNLISSFIQPEDTDIETIFRTIESSMLIAKDGNGNIYFPDLGINSIGNWIFAKGYNIYMTNAEELEITGLSVSPEDNPIELSEGWNMIAYLRNSAMPVANAFSDIVDNILIVKNGAGDIYFPALNINSIQQMYPGMGYKVYAQSECDLLYPENSLPKNISKGISDFSTSVLQLQFERTGENSTLIIAASELEDAIEAGVWDSSGQLVGAGRIIDGMAAVTVWGDNSMTKVKDGSSEGELLTMKFIDSYGNAVPYEISAIQNPESEGYIDNIRYFADDIIIVQISAKDQEDRISVTPNPARDEILIRSELRYMTNYEIMITDAEGKIVNKTLGITPNSGQISEYISLSNLPAGIYYVSMITESGVFRKRFIRVK